MKPSTWQDLVFEARQALHSPSTLDKSKGFISFLYEPSFDNPFSLNLAWNGEQCYWKKLAWDKQNDAHKFDVIGNLAYIGQIIKPTLITLPGEIPIDRGNSLVDMVQRLTLPILRERDRWVILDGETTTLTIGNLNWEVTYKWAILPQEWNNLAEIQRMLIELSEELGKENI
jgi:hypothetical protein